MISLINKYKDRLPEETIEIVSNFFERNKLKIKITDNRKTEIGTYSCHVDLYKGTNLVLSSNGKGMTEIYSLASGYAELYERFCNKMNFISNTFALRKMEKLKELTHFIFAPDESIQEPNNAVLNFPCLYNALSTIFPDQNMLNQFFNIITNGQAICLPYTNIENSNDQIWVDPRATKFTLGSIGMAAGNTYQEALTQGISEIYEHEVNALFYLEPQEKYYAIDLDKIENENLQNIIQAIRNKGYKLYILDLSYNFNCPVLVSVLINPYDKCIFTNFGANPIFDIACERIFTELYQGIDNYWTTRKLQKPYYSFSTNEIIDKFFNSGSVDSPIFPEFIFDRLEFVDYNKNVFLSKDCDLDDNNILNQYYYELNHKLNIKMWVRNYSLDNNMFAIHILSDSNVVAIGKALGYKDISPLIKASVLKYCAAIKKLTDNFLSDEDIGLKAYRLHSIIEMRNHNGLKDKFGAFIGNTLWTDPLNPIPKTDLFLIDNLNSIPMEDTRGLEIFYNTIFHPYYKLYNSLYSYIKCEEYTNEEIKYIFAQIFDTEITDEDIFNYNNGKYLIEKIYFEPVINYYNSLEYTELISSMFIPNLNITTKEKS